MQDAQSPQQPCRIVLRSGDRDPGTSVGAPTFSRVYLPGDLRGPGTLLVHSFDSFISTGNNYIFELRVKGLNTAPALAQSYMGDRDTLATMRGPMLRVGVSTQTRGIMVPDMSRLFNGSPLSIAITRPEGGTPFMLTDWTLVLALIPAV